VAPAIVHPSTVAEDFVLFLFCSRDQVIHNVLALVMVYDDTSRQWLPCGNALQYANIYILFNETAKIYRFYGIDSKDGEVKRNIGFFTCGHLYVSTTALRLSLLLFV
jgi:hypothetical protein